MRRRCAVQRNVVSFTMFSRSATRRLKPKKKSKSTANARSHYNNNNRKTWNVGKEERRNRRTTRRNATAIVCHALDTEDMTKQHMANRMKSIRALFSHRTIRRRHNYTETTVRHSKCVKWQTLSTGKTNETQTISATRSFERNPSYTTVRASLTIRF